jgi:tetratricopeptide (TPR) repeat protein
MMSKAPAVVSAAVLWLAVYPPRAEAQAAFLDTVRELAATATASGITTADDLTLRRTAAHARMRTALAEWDRAIKTLESRVGRELRDARDERAFQLRVELGLAYRQRGRLGDALQAFDAAAAAQPGASDVHVLRALTLEAAGNTSEAGRAFRTAWLRDATNPVKAYLALRPRSDLDAAERERALKVLRDAFERMLTNDKQVRGAPFLVLDPVPDSLSRTPVVGDARLAGVFARLVEGKLDDAVATLNASSSTAGGTDNDSPLAHFERGRAAEIQGRQTDARGAYTTALAGTLTGRHVLHVAIGRLSQVEGELDAAIAAFGHAVRLNPNDPVIHRELAGAYAEAGRIDDAFAELAAALLIDPRNVDTMAAAGRLFLEQDRLSDAIAILSRAVEVNSNKAEAHYALAVALSRAGRAEEAARQFERFERLSREALEHRRREVTGQAAPGDVKP